MKVMKHVLHGRDGIELCWGADDEPPKPDVHKELEIEPCVNGWKVTVNHCTDHVFTDWKALSKFIRANCKPREA